MSTGSKPVGFKTLQETTGYISVDDGNVIKVVCTVMKVAKRADKLADGLPNYNIQTALNIAVMTKEEYDAVKKGDISE